MREQVTFAVDANGGAHYVGLSSKMREGLGVDELGSSINDWPGDFPSELTPGFYTAVLQVLGPPESPDLQWQDISLLNARPKSSRMSGPKGSGSR